MSHSIIVPPVHETSPPPFDDDVDDQDVIPTFQYDELESSTTPDVLNNSNDEWKSVDENNDTDIAQIQDDLAIVDSENNSANINPTNDEPTQEENNNNDDDDDDDWANFATFENKTEEVSETPPAVTSIVVEESTENDWADFESNTVPSSEQSTHSPNEEQTSKVVEDEDDDFGDFSEVQVAPKPPTPSLPINTLTSEQIDSVLTVCFPMESESSSTEENSITPPDLPSFTTYKDPSKQISYLESSLSLWNVLSNLSNDPLGIKFQWRKSNTERLFHQALGVNERFRTKNIPLTPEILQPEIIKLSLSTNTENENIENENKLSAESIRPHFDWKRSGLQDPLSDNDSSSLSSNISKNEDHVFDANKTLDLDFYVPISKSSNIEEENTTLPPSSIQRNDSPIIQIQQRSSVPIKTIDLFPGSTTTLTDDAKRIIDTLPNFSFMSAKALMFPVRFNANNNDELY